MTDDVVARIRTEVEAHGWHVVLVPRGGEGEPAFGFTVGLASSFDHPEIVTVGLDQGEANGLMHQLLDSAAETVAEGGSFRDGQEDGDLLVDYRVAVKPVARRHFATWLSFLTEFHGEGQDFDCLQVVWPDRAGRFPWDDDFDQKLRPRQPLLDG